MAHYITEDCVGCTLCKRSCPVNAVDGALKARHVINAARCMDCGVCGRVCAAGAIQDERGARCKRVSKSEWKKPAVEAALCSACSVCVEICGRDALAISLPKFRGDLAVFAELAHPDACVGCGICGRVCPLHAITMQTPEPAKEAEV